MAGKKPGGSATETPVAGRGRRRSGQKGTADRQLIEKLVEEAIAGIEKRLSDTKSPPSIGDYLKVMQLQKEIADEAPKEIRITWVEPPQETTSESEK